MASLKFSFIRLYFFWKTILNTNPLYFSRTGNLVLLYDWAYIQLFNGIAAQCEPWLCWFTFPNYYLSWAHIRLRGVLPRKIEVKKFLPIGMVELTYKLSQWPGFTICSDFYIFLLANLTLFVLSEVALGVRLIAYLRFFSISRFR